jgi:hypothetical protein
VYRDETLQRRAVARWVHVVRRERMEKATLEAIAGILPSIVGDLVRFGTECWLLLESGPK